MITLPMIILAAALAGGSHGSPPVPGAVVGSWYGDEVAGNPMAGGGGLTRENSPAPTARCLFAR
jgi:hypothetical protein